MHQLYTANLVGKDGGKSSKSDAIYLGEPGKCTIRVCFGSRERAENKNPGLSRGSWYETLSVIEDQGVY